MTSVPLDAAAAQPAAAQPDVTVVSDQRLIASALANAVRESGLTARHVTSDELVESVVRLADGGCVIVDTSMELASDVCAAAKQNERCTLALLLTGSPEAGSDAASAISSFRPDGVLCADLTPGQFVDALRLLLRGQLVYLVDGEVRETLLDESQWHASDAPATELAASQRRLLELLARGRPDVELADLLHLSVATVRRRIAELRDLTGTSNRIELAAWAGRHGIYDES